MLRRTLLKAVSGIAAFAVFKPKLADAEKVIEVLPDNDFVRIPDWCPKGFLPILGQRVTPKQFPSLFEPMKLSNGKTFYPIFWGKPYGIVEDLPIKEILSYKEPSFDKDGNFIIKDGRILYEVVGDMVFMSIIATEPFRWNGSLIPPGFHDKLVIEKDKFEAFYGKKEVNV